MSNGTTDSPELNQQDSNAEQVIGEARDVAENVIGEAIATDSIGTDGTESAAIGEPGSVAQVQQPEFADLQDAADLQTPIAGNTTDLSRLNEVQVTVAAELGRTKVPIAELLKMREGSVFELNRSIENPVELRAQGVPLGNGEVVVVDGNFAIRIQEIYRKENEV